MLTKRKYLIEYPTLSQTNLMENIIVKDIVQIYLREIEEGIERKIIRVFTNNNTICYYTEKKKNSELISNEKKQIITACEYLKFILEALTSINEIKKYKLCFTYENKNFELDVYPKHEEEATLNVEFEYDGKDAMLPPFISIIKEITNNRKYKDSSLAQNNIIK